MTDQAVPIPPPSFGPGMHVQGSPMTVAVNIIQVVEGKAVVLRIESVNGSFTFPMDPDTAIQIGANLRENGRNAKSGLHVPPQLDL